MKRALDGAHALLAYQRGLTLMAMKLAISAPAEKAVHRLLVLMDLFTPAGGRGQHSLHGRPEEGAQTIFIVHQSNSTELPIL
jgi:hypothetical protein